MDECRGRDPKRFLGQICVTPFTTLDNAFDRPNFNRIYRRAVPSARSCAALLLITAGAVAYIACDREFRVKGVRAYFWASVLVG